MFLRSGAVEMRALARELGIGRATLYRWSGSREGLFADVLADLGVANLRHCERDVRTPPGPARFVEVHDLHIRRISGNPRFREFIRAEPRLAHRLLLTADGRVHRAATAALAELVRRQEAESGWRAPLGADAFAAVVTQMSEAFMYGDLIGGTPPDVLTPTLVLRLMLGLDQRGDDAAAGTRQPARRGAHH
jgi:AcrR family transcriptional regulator